jgi:large conductance mechanosensitive channel
VHQMLKGFKDFILRGNIVELAVAFVIGTAFAKVIDTFVGAIVTPIINAFPGANTNGWGFSLRGGQLEGRTFINISTLINAVIVFVITAAAVYFILVVPLRKINEMRGVTPEEAVKTDEARLLEEIRDLLRQEHT